MQLLCFVEPGCIKSARVLVQVQILSPVHAHLERRLAHRNQMRRTCSPLLQHGRIAEHGSRSHPEVRFDSLMLQSIRCAAGSSVGATKQWNVKWRDESMQNFGKCCLLCKSLASIDPRSRGCRTVEVLYKLYPCSGQPGTRGYI